MRVYHWQCPNCGSREVQQAVWMDMNTGEVVQAVWDDRYYCPDCEEDIVPEESEEDYDEYGIHDNPKKPRPGKKMNPRDALVEAIKYASKVVLGENISTNQAKKAVLGKSTGWAVKSSYGIVPAFTTETGLIPNPHLKISREFTDAMEKKYNQLSEVRGYVEWINAAVGVIMRS